MVKYVMTYPLLKWQDKRRHHSDKYLNIYSHNLDYQIGEHNEPYQFPNINRLCVPGEHNHVVEQPSVATEEMNDDYAAYCEH